MENLQNITIRSASVGTMDNNVYVLTDKDTGAQVLIDAADDFAAIQRLLAEGAADARVPAKLELVITTHSHWDHVRALAETAAATGARTAAGTEDIGDIEVPTVLALEHGDRVPFGGAELEALKLRGHTPGSVALLYREPDAPAHLFTGDSLFPGGLGNTQKDPERFASLYRDVFERIFEYLPDDTVVHPGHGAGTTLGAERPHLAEWKERGW
ncbi:MBL fold metallo-hydrolase [Arthrobacter zhangbolii]|uniref:MBL fold metallo-hydrolase n=1 Tax=Arthrobacter zhangbolii TaxID=2886936 RepID=A0A9X1S7I2_9MICC|nr:MULTISPECIES: MBL fold metallo-hydrolase [Arthrobacter]MCC3271555.1 MBL fold metallo-hydrolase [Arthrobacter zhangbolii]MCC3293464.1 MBL fold metallo-hydrolase [Arthrobacter zhangbolii]MDN3904628.1 MBL fold metallo-hydrolase [Arthrobacter sp. YD2]UON90678.1 MBL fold metallo-hydrolase [Arthrobacter zhangbolii]